MLLKMMKNRAIKAFAKKFPKFLVVSWRSSNFSANDFSVSADSHFFSDGGYTD